MTELQQLRKERRKQTAEDFTPPELVNEMLDKLPSEVFIEPSKTLCDPAAGNGTSLLKCSQGNCYMDTTLSKRSLQFMVLSLWQIM